MENVGCAASFGRKRQQKKNAILSPLLLTSTQRPVMLVSEEIHYEYISQLTQYAAAEAILMINSNCI